jgi:hypothetical protein
MKLKDHEWAALNALSIGARLAVFDILRRHGENQWLKGYILGAIVSAVTALVVRALA